jgi:hypothetical protein
MPARASRPRLSRVFALTLALSVGGVPCLAAADAPSHPCAQVRDDTARLRCYDEAFAQPVDDLTATVTAVERGAQGRFVATLDNGEVWAQTEITSKVDVAVGDVVKVRRASFGSYLLTGRQGIATRVKRLD